MLFYSIYILFNAFSLVSLASFKHIALPILCYLGFDLSVFLEVYSMSSPLHFPLLIVVPTLNSFVSLSRLLESLKAQTLSLEILFIDGPSSSQHRELAAVML